MCVCVCARCTSLHALRKPRSCLTEPKPPPHAGIRNGSVRSTITGQNDRIQQRYNIALSCSGNTPHTQVWSLVSLCVCVCERERERERGFWGQLHSDGESRQKMKAHSVGTHARGERKSYMPLCITLGYVVRDTRVH